MNIYTRDIEIVNECNDEDGNPTCWAMLIGTDSKEKRHYLWITKYRDNEYRIENSDGYDLANKTYKTLQGAKKKAEIIAFRQQEMGFYTD